MNESDGICIEYICGNDSFHEKEDDRDRIKRILKYRDDFYELLASNLGINYSQYNLRTAMELTYKYDYAKLLQPLSFKFSCSLYNDADEVATELNKFKLLVISYIKNLAKVKGNEALIKGIIRDSNGKDRTDVALRVMKKALIAAKMKGHGCSNKTIIKAIYGKNPVGEDIEKEKDHISMHLKNAEVLMERVKNGTFPYDEDGEWKLT